MALWIELNALVLKVHLVIQLIDGKQDYFQVNFTQFWYFYIVMHDLLYYMWLNISKGTTVGKLDCKLQGCKVKIPQNMVPWSILRFHIFLNLALEVAEYKNCKNELLNCLKAYTLYRFPNFQGLFYQNQLFTNLSWCLQ